MKFPWTKKASRARDEPAKPGVKTIFRAVARPRADNSLSGSEAIYAAVSRISNTMASMPIHLYRGRVVQTENPLEALVARSPNVNFTPFTFLQTLEALRNTEGRAYALIVPNEGTGAGVCRLDILDPVRVTPQRHPKTREMWYSILLDDGKRYMLPGCQMIVLKHMSGNGELGIRPIDVLRGSLDYDQQVKELSLNQLDGVNQGVFLSVPGTGLDVDARRRVINDFMEAYTESGQRVVILEGGVTATTFSQPAINAQVLDVERITRNRVATVYNIPPHMLGDYTDTSFATAEQQLDEFIQLTILPIVTQYEQELDRKLLTDAEYRQGYRFRYDVDALRRADVAAMANKHQMAIRGGWMRPNEVREREGLPPDAFGNELMASRDLLPLKIAVERPELLLGAAGETDGGENGN